MKIGTINILGINYVVKNVPVVDKEQFQFAQINYLEQTILLDETMLPQQKTLSLMHEIVHGCLVGLGYNELNEDETFIQSFAVALCSCTEIRITNYPSIKDLLKEGKA